MGGGYSNRCSDCGSESECESDYDCGGETRGLQERRIRAREATMQERRRENARYEDADQDEYAVVSAKAARSYDEAARQAVVSPQEIQEREMGMLKLEEQKIKNKIANERLAFDTQKRQQAREIHEIKVALLSNYPNIMFNRQGISDFKAE